MVIKSHENFFGAWAFLIGVVLAIVIGISTSSFFSFSTIVNYSSQIYAVLIILGLIVGFTIKVSGKDTQTFLYTGAILVIVSSFAKEGAIGVIGIGLGDVVSSTFGALLTLFAPATIVVALKTVFSFSKV